MDNEEQFIRSLMSGSRKAAPAGFTETVMGQVRAMEERRIRRRLVLAIVLRTALFTGLFVLLVVPSIVKGIRIDGVARLVEEAGQDVVGILKNVYFLLPLLVLLVGRKLFAIK
jgi:hypothetical protein